MNPTRTSIWDDERFPRAHGRLGRLPRVARELVERARACLVTPASNYLEIAERWVAGAPLDVYAGQRTRGGARAAAADIDELVR